VSSPTPAATDAPVLRVRLFPHVVVFLTAACAMIVELTASRLVARQYGTTLHTWAALIAAILAGLSAGSWLGGRLADRAEPARLASWLLLACSVLCLATLPVMTGLQAGLRAVPYLPRLALVIGGAFLPPALALGAVAPVMARLAVLRGPGRRGAALGAIAAWGAVGSVAGTLLAGFVLVGGLGARATIVVMALLLMIPAALLASPRGRYGHLAWVTVVWAALFLTRAPWPIAQRAAIRLGLVDPVGMLTVDSDYQLVSVALRVDGEPPRTLRVLRLDALDHSYFDPRDPFYLHYEYERALADVTLRVLGGQSPEGREQAQLSVAAFFLGGGGYSFPRWMQQRWPRARIEVAEIDPVVVQTAHQFLGLPRDTPIRTHLADGRIALKAAPTNARFDLIFTDVFSDLAVPWHLTTLEFARLVASHLSPGGFYALNVIDELEPGRLLGSVLVTLERVFPRVRVLSMRSTQARRKHRTTFLLVASRAPLPLPAWPMGHRDRFDGVTLPDAELARLRRHGRVLTDDNAPVDLLLEPVTRSRMR
jgi:MFS family permease